MPSEFQFKEPPLPSEFQKGVRRGVWIFSGIAHSNVPHLHSLVSVCCIESIFQVKLLIVFSSIKQTYDGSVVSIVRME